MQLNLVDLLKGQVGSILADKAASYLGENKAVSSKAVDAILPILLGSAASSASTPKGAESLLSLLNSGKHDGSILDNIDDMLGSGAKTDSLMSSGSGIMNALLGNKVGGLVSLISSFVGMKGSSVSSLISMAAPLVMGLLGKQVKSSGLDASGLMSMLLGQQKNIASAIPAGLMSGLGSLGFANFVGSSAQNAANAVEEASSSAYGRILPWLLGALALAGALYYWKGCNATPKPETAIIAVDTLADTTTDTTTTTTETELKLTAGTQEEALLTFIKDATKQIDKTTWFDFPEIQFDVNKATLKAESMGKINAVLSILKAYPNVKLKVGGYTDKDGAAERNKTLSGERANTVKAKLVELGIAADRLDAEGYGSEYAKGTTPEEKAKDRRISFRVTAK